MADRKVEDNTTKKDAAATAAAAASGVFEETKTVAWSKLKPGDKNIGKVAVRKRGDKLRLVSKATGRVVKNKAGTAVDGGGHSYRNGESTRKAMWQMMQVQHNARRIIS